MALSTTGFATSWGYVNGEPHISEQYYLIGMKPNIKECCNIIAKYFNITNNKLEYFINHSLTFETPNHLMPITVIDSFLLKFYLDPEAANSLLTKINQLFQEKQLKCKLKIKDLSRNLLEQHNFILEQEYLDTQYEDRYLKQKLSIADIALIPTLEEIDEESPIACR